MRMDEWTLNDLLECSVCLERLDTSSKVLPCQHTFCKKCLEEIVVTKKELRCPECRVLVETSIEDLPPNVLLMRILEGMRNAAPKKKIGGGPTIHHQRSHSQPVAGTIFPSATVAAAVPATVTQHLPISLESVARNQSSVKQISVLTQPYARAVYDYVSKEPGDLSFKKGDIITLKKQVDQNWYHGEIGGVHGVFPLCYVQIMPAPVNMPQCKALYDFRMTNDEEEGCLAFTKGEIITVIRRVDENWAEGKSSDKVGIFPIAFVEMNGVARALMKLSSNFQPGPSRLAPPTPTSEDTTPLISMDSSQAGVPSQSQYQLSQTHALPQPQVLNLPVSQSQPPPQLQLQPQPQPQPQPQTATLPQTQCSSQLSALAPSHVQPSGQAAPQLSQVSSSLKTPSSVSVTTSFPQTDSSSSTSISSTTPNTSCTSSSSSSSTTPSSPSSPPPRPSAWSPQTHQLRVSSSAPSTDNNQYNQQKRHSLTALLATPALHASSNRHSAEVLGSGELNEMVSEPALIGEFVRQGSGRNHRRSGSSELPLSSIGSIPPPPPQGVHHCHVNNSNLPAMYIALYPYKPQKADELELRKGGLYTVTERCQDGWFKGTSNRTQKSGVFPGNYVTLFQPVPQLRTGSRGTVSSNTPTRSASSGAVSPLTAGGASSSTTNSSSPVSYMKDRKSTSVSPQTPNLRQQPQGSDPPSLPPRSASPAQTRVFTAGPWHSAKAPKDAPPQIQSGQNNPQPSAQSAVSPLHVSTNASSGTSLKLSMDKAKEKKDRGSVSLMKRLTNMRKSKSPPPPYSMDNPVFEDGSVLSSPSHSINPAHPVHVRSGSCPSQLLQLPQPEPFPTSSAQQGQPLHHRVHPGPGGAGGSQRLRHKERPNVVITNFSLSGRSSDVGVAASPNSVTNSSHHRKSSSLDAGSHSSSSNGQLTGHTSSHSSSQGESGRKAKQLVQPARERFRCVVPYPPHSEYELELRVGDVIYVHRKREDGWYKGTQQRTGKTGLFPASFVEAF